MADVNAWKAELEREWTLQEADEARRDLKAVASSDYPKPFHPWHARLRLAWPGMLGDLPWSIAERIASDRIVDTYHKRLVELGELKEQKDEKD